ncbi:hypothetical protein AX16_000974 [Volvariella volvacea WC 439]|nr:hypothetical protein AX16_000974 [Volvariella volvacea WC 439]
MQHQHSIPTPPVSPRIGTHTQDQPDSSLQSTLNLLDNLVSFYQQERLWVHQTRASLVDVYQQQQSPAHCGADDFDQSQFMPSPPPSTAPAEPDGIIIKTESVPDMPISTSIVPSSRWTRRKRGFKMHLDGISSTNRRTSPHHHPSHAHPYPRERILEMFEKMMEARMESCERVNRLVRDANRVELYSR